MAMDDRIIHLVRQEVDRVLTEADAGADSLHAELHALATRVAELEQRLSDPTTGAVPRASRARKATDTA